jgi:hypothetical protein
MRLPALFLGLASLLLVACARNTVDCAMGEARSDCAPGTAGAEKRALQEEAARTFETIDDTRCRSFANDLQSYLECRRKVANARQSF